MSSTREASRADIAHDLCRAFHTFLNRKVCEAYKPIQTRMARTYVLDCYKKPREHIDHAKKCAFPLIF